MIFGAETFISPDTDRPVEYGSGALIHRLEGGRDAGVQPVTQITDAHRRVFGADVKLDANGFPIETGIKGRGSNMP
jgi:hypothetical protein